MLAPRTEDDSAPAEPACWAYLLPGRAGWYEAVLAWIEQARVPARPLTYRTCEDLVGDVRDGLGCVIADTRLADARGVEIVAKLRVVRPRPSILLVSGSPTVDEVVATIKAGACDYLEEPLVFERFQEAFGKAMVEARLRAEHRAKLRKLEERFQTVSAREGEVLGLLARGLSSKSIAAELKVSKRTVDYHRGQLMAKVGVESSVELVSLFGEMRRMRQTSPLAPPEATS